MTIRKQLRVECEERFNEILDKAASAIEEIIDDTGVAFAEVTKCLSQKRHQSVRNAAINRMTNKAEQDLVDFYNEQRDLELEEKDAA